jgi:hypothetical protein
MAPETHRFGTTTFAKAKTAKDFKHVLADPQLRSDPIIVKPNWVTDDAGTFTTAATLRKVFEALPGKIIVTEGYQLGRSWNQTPCGETFTVDGEEHDWLWFRKKGWNWLHTHPDWGWFRDGTHRDAVRKEDRLFLDRHGFTDLLSEFGAEYVNVTEEVWSGRGADPKTIKDTVEARHGPCFTPKLYDIVPQRLHRHRGATLISLTRLKEYNSFTLKNLFGLIPDPIRSWWHGPHDNRLTKSIVDTAKVYDSLFTLYGVWEYGAGTRLRNPIGNLGEEGWRYDIVDGPGRLAAGSNLAEMDALLHHLTGYADEGAEHIQAAKGVLGDYDAALLPEAEKKIRNWFKVG